MKNFILLLSLLCSIAVRAQTFTKKANFPGGERWRGFSFALGDMIYTGAGNDSTNQVGNWVGTAMHRTFWQYNTLTDTWTQKNNLPFTPRNDMASFVVGGVGFAGLGFDSLLNTRDDWWKYNEATDTWTQLSNFPGGDRLGAATFNWNGKGYIMGGESWRIIDTSFHRVYKDLWEYTPATDSWTRLNDFPGAARGFGFCHVIDNMLYAGLGSDDSLGVYYSDNFKCDLTTGIWSAMAPVPPTSNVPVVDGPASFCAHAGHKLMIMNVDVTYTNPNDLKTVYIYNTANNTWTLIALANTPGWRFGSSCAQIGNKAYMGTGADYYNWIWPIDFWEVNMQSFVTGIENTNPGLENIYVSSVVHTVSTSIPESILLKGKVEMSVYSMDGKCLHTYPLTVHDQFDMNELPSGNYAFNIKCGMNTLKTGIILLN